MVEQKRAYVRHCRPPGLSVTQGCRLMGLARSTCHDEPMAPAPDDAVISRIRAVGEEFEAYGYRRICAELRH